MSHSLRRLKRPPSELQYYRPNQFLTMCACTKSKCIKLYCPCFSSGIACSVECKCTQCFNHVLNHDDCNRFRYDETFNVQDSDISTQSLSCNCKNSKCLKKYCECCKNGVTCNKSCKCKNCANIALDCTEDSDDDSLFSPLVPVVEPRKSHI